MNNLFSASINTLLDKAASEDSSASEIVPCNLMDKFAARMKRKYTSGSCETPSESEYSGGALVAQITIDQERFVLPIETQNLTKRFQNLVSIFGKNHVDLVAAIKTLDRAEAKRVWRTICTHFNQFRLIDNGEKTSIFKPPADEVEFLREFAKKECRNAENIDLSGLIKRNIALVYNEIVDSAKKMHRRFFSITDFYSRFAGKIFLDDYKNILGMLAMDKKIILQHQNFSLPRS